MPGSCRHWGSPPRRMAGRLNPAVAVSWEPVSPVSLGLSCWECVYEGTEVRTGTVLVRVTVQVSGRAGTSLGTLHQLRFSLPPCPASSVGVEDSLGP